MTEPKRHISPSVLRQKADNGRTLMLSPQVLRELADYIEWMQQRIAELEATPLAQPFPFAPTPCQAATPPCK